MQASSIFAPIGTGKDRHRRKATGAEVTETSAVGRQHYYISSSHGRSPALRQARIICRASSARTGKLHRKAGRRNGRSSADNDARC